MKNPFSRLNLIASSLAVAAMLCLPASTRGITYTIDPNQSFLTLNGVAFGLSYVDQGSGSRLDKWSGTIQGNLDITGTQLTFTGGSVLTAGLNLYSPILPNIYPIIQSAAPAGDGVTIEAAAPYGINNYGVHASGLVPNYGACLVDGAYQGLVWDIPTGTAVNGSASTANLQFTAGEIHYIGYALGGAVRLGDVSSLIGINGNNASASTVSLSTVGSISTLILPIQVQTIGDNRAELWVGQLVATAVIPEPSSLALVLVGLGLAAVRARARRP
jgi:hypothetical protein